MILAQKVYFGPTVTWQLIHIWWKNKCVHINLDFFSPFFNTSCCVAKSCLTPCDHWTAACLAPLSFTISWSLLKFMSIELVTLSNMDKLYCLYSPWNSPDQNTGVDSRSLLQIFPTQGIKPRAPSLQTVFTSWAHREAHCLMGTNHIVCFINFSLSAGYVVI